MSSYREIASYMIFTCNTLLTASSIALIIFGSVHITEHSSKFFYLLGNRFCTGKGALGLGLVLLAITALGYYANCSERKNFLLVYAVLLIALFVAQICLGIIVAIALNPHEGFSKQIENEFEELFRRNDTKFMKNLDNIQKKFECCGVRGAKDYHTLPDSCCSKKTNHNCTDVYTVGCGKIYAHLLDTSLKVIGFISFVFSLPEPITAWFALCLRRTSSDPVP